MKRVSSMRYKYIIPTLCICGTVSLHSEESGLGDILQQVGKKEALVKPEPKTKVTKKKSRFIFYDEYDSNGIGSKEQSDKSETYNYENKSRFKFKFNDGSGQSNLMGSPGTGGSMGGGTGGKGGRR